MRAHFDGVHTPGVRTHGRPTHRNRAHPRLRRDAGRIGGAAVGVLAQPPRPGGQDIRRFMDRGQVVHPCGPHLHAPVCACCRRRTRCTRHPKTFSRFAAPSPQHARPGAFRRRRGARTRRQTGRGRLSMMNPSPVATLPRRSRESGTSHRRSDADDDGSARRRSAPTASPTHASSAPPVRDDGQPTWRRRRQSSESRSRGPAPAHPCDAPGVPSAGRSRQQRG